MLQTILNRRSIRKYKSENVPSEAIKEILKAGILAPSSKNRQPWKFIVVSGKAKESMLSVMRQGIEREKQDPLLPNSTQYISGAETTVKIVEQAPVIILVINPLGFDLDKSLSPEDRIYEICNAQSVGAAIENMTLTAEELGLGSLWICDTFFAHRELSDWLCINGQLYAALAVGYKDENPSARPRNSFDDVVEWRD